MVVQILCGWRVCEKIHAAEGSGRCGGCRGGVPDGGAAYLIANTIRKVDRQIIVSYVDTAYREEVTPLQLAGFYYTGVTGKHTDPVVTGRTGHHASLTV